MNHGLLFLFHARINPLEPVLHNSISRSALGTGYIQLTGSVASRRNRERCLTCTGVQLYTTNIKVKAYKNISN